MRIRGWWLKTGSWEGSRGRGKVSYGEWDVEWGKRGKGKWKYCCGKWRSLKDNGKVDKWEIGVGTWCG